MDILEAHRPGQMAFTHVVLREAALVLECIKKMTCVISSLTVIKLNIFISIIISTFILSFQLMTLLLKVVSLFLHLM